MWATALALLGTYNQLLGYSLFALNVFHVGTGLALFRLRRTRPEALRPYRVWGYPWVPAIFVVTSLGFVVATVVTSPRDSAIGLVLMGLGIPAYAWWRRRHSA